MYVNYHFKISLKGDRSAGEHMERQPEVPRAAVPGPSCPVLGLERAPWFASELRCLVGDICPSLFSLPGAENEHSPRALEALIFSDVVFASSFRLLSREIREEVHLVCGAFKPSCFLVFSQQALVVGLLVQSTLRGAGAQRPEGDPPTPPRWVIA